jgi:transcriptional regulator with XRE-family HTH domain
MVDSRLAIDERAEFSQRLRHALEQAGYSSSPSAFVREYNLRADGAVVSVHAARKWLLGESIPTQEKLQILARWLGVSVDWLRFGGAVEEGARAASVPEAVAQIANDLNLLGADDQHIVHDLIKSMLRHSGRTERGRV